MASIFNSLSIGYSGLNVAQVGIDTTAHNISNAETDGYSRQRVINTARTPITAGIGNVGNGAEIQVIERIFDNFVFDRFIGLSSNKEYSDYEKKSLETLSTYFPEIDDVGVKADLQEYYNMWQSFSDNPDNDSIKLALAKQAEVLSDHIRQTQNQVIALQSQINDEMAVNIEEVNSLLKSVTEINRSIIEAEDGGDNFIANDLRDKRNVIERDLSRLIGATANTSLTESHINIDSSANLKSENYVIILNGFNIVDGSSFHPLKLNRVENASGFYEISYERQDGALIPLEEKINGGKIGAQLDLRGGTIDSTSGMPTDGTLQEVISSLDAFAQGLIEATNNLYAQTPATRMESNRVTELPGNNSILSSSLNVKAGEFDIIIYDIDGNETARRSIAINLSTTMEGASGTNSIEGQISANADDNGDGNANNNIDDFITTFNWATYADGSYGLELAMDSLSESKGYTFAIADKLKDSTFDSGSNFAGALGLNRFFDGDSAQSIDLHSAYKNNPTLLSAGYSASSGDSRVALDMIQQQFEKYDFNVGVDSYNTTIYGMFDVVSTKVGTDTNSAITRNDTITAQFHSVELQYASVSKVSIDEEMTNLIKYQTAYGAAAKIITTIDQMMQTLLGIKQ